MSLIDAARLTDEEIAACLFDPDGWGRLDEQVQKAVADAQLAKALWWCAEHVCDDTMRTPDLSGLYSLREGLMFAGIERPKEA